MPTSAKTDLSSRIDELPELLPFPAVALKLMHACKNPECGVRDLCQIIECDASLSLKLLRISNSSLYGCPGQIKTVEHAAVVLGVKGLRDLAMSAAAADVFKSDGKNDVAVQWLWHHSLGCATMARIIAERVPEVSCDEAFVAGLVHDAGKLVFVELLGDDYDLLDKSMQGISTVEEELARFGISHAELGGRCGEEWGLPGEISDAIGAHHCLDEAVFSESLAAVVGAANQISKIWKIGSDQDTTMEIDDVIAEFGLSLETAELDAMQECAPDAFAAIQEAFGN